MTDTSNTSTYDEMAKNPETARLMEIEEGKLTITEYLAWKYDIHIPDDRRLDELFEDLIRLGRKYQYQDITNAEIEIKRREKLLKDYYDEKDKEERDRELGLGGLEPDDVL